MSNWIFTSYIFDIQYIIHSYLIAIQLNICFLTVNKDPEILPTPHTAIK